MCTAELSDESIACERGLKAHLAGYDAAAEELLGVASLIEFVVVPGVLGAVFQLFLGISQASYECPES
jgi:hypothetical protein